MIPLPRKTAARGGVPLAAALGVVALVTVGAFAAGRLTAGKAASETKESSLEPAPVVFRPGDAEAPPWAPMGRWSIPMAGSIFRSGISTAESPLEGFEAVLVSPLADECLDDCPLGLRVVGGKPGSVIVRKLVPSLGPNFDAIEDAGGVPPGIMSGLRETEAALKSRSESQGGESHGSETGRAPVRALFISMPRPDLGTDRWSVGLAVHDMTDSHFDRSETGATPHGGHRLLISRVAKRAEGTGRPQIVSGALEIGVAPDGRGLRAIPASATDLGRTFGSLWGHFGGLPELVAGLYLSEDGRIYAYGSDLVLRPLPNRPELRHALEALLRRP